MGSTISHLTVSSLSIIFMTVSAILAIFLPTGLVIGVAVKKRLNGLALLIGICFFIGFALVLESIMHWLVLGSSFGKSFILAKPVIYALYGGLAAGIFEETARLLGFKILVNRKNGRNINTAISYGLGHGGIEAILLGGLAMVINIINAIMINSGAMGNVLKALPAAQADTVMNGMNALVTTSSPMFLMGGVERVMALAIQVSLSIFVFRAVVERKWIYYILAILIHAAVDFPAVFVQLGIIKNLYLFEGLVLVMTILIVIAAYKIRPASVETADGIEIAAGTGTGAETGIEAESGIADGIGFPPAGILDQEEPEQTVEAEGQASQDTHQAASEGNSITIEKME